MPYGHPQPLAFHRNFSVVASARSVACRRRPLELVILLVRRLGRVSSRRCGCKGEHRAEGIVRRCPPALGLFLAGPPIQNGPWHGAGRGL